jgi:hypothetical protein
VGASPHKRSSWRECGAEFFQKHRKIVNMTMLLGPPVKSQISGAFYRAYQKRPTGGCEEKEAAQRRSKGVRARRLFSISCRHKQSLTPNGWRRPAAWRRAPSM